VDQGLADKTDRIEVFYLPKYAPERNPDEYGVVAQSLRRSGAEGIPPAPGELTPA
jgi:hypothetical protein